MPPHWELPQCQCAPAPILGTQCRHPQGHWSCLQHQTSWLFSKTLQTGNHQLHPTTAASQGAFLRGQGWSSRFPAHPCDNSLQLHYSPPIEKVMKNNLGITSLIGLQPSSGTHTVTNTAVLKRRISRAPVGAGSCSWRHIPSRPRAVPLPPCVTCLASPAAGLCCHSLHCPGSLLPPHCRDSGMDGAPQAGPFPRDLLILCFWDPLVLWFQDNL